MIAFLESELRTAGDLEHSITCAAKDSNVGDLKHMEEKRDSLECDAQDVSMLGVTNLESVGLRKNRVLAEDLTEANKSCSAIHATNTQSSMSHRVGCVNDAETVNIERKESVNDTVEVDGERSFSKFMLKKFRSFFQN